MAARRTIGRAAGTLEYCAAVLGRLQHRPPRAEVENIRGKLAEASADLLLFRAHLAPTETREHAEAS